MNIIIAGNGKMGSSLTRQLSSEGYSITVIDSNATVLESIANDYDIMTIHGNCASMDVLLKANVESADLLIAVTNQDETNLLCCVTAHVLNPDLHTIARIRNPDYSEQVYKMHEMFALNMTVNPERQAAKEIESLLKYPGFLRRDTFAKGRVEIVELRIDENSKLCNQPLSSLHSITGCKVLICAVLRGGTAVTPNGNFILQENDRIFVTASIDNISTLLENLGLIRREVKKVLICGGGRISYYLTQKLIKSRMDVTIIEKDFARCEYLSEKLPEATIVHGDASRQSLLDSEGIFSSDAIVSLTGLDEQNMVISMYASTRDVPKVVTKLAHLESSPMLNRLPLGSTVNPMQLCCNTIIRYVRALRNQTGAALSVHTIADNQVEALEFLVDENTKHCGEPLKNLKLKRNVLIASIVYATKTEILSGDSIFQPGDTVIVVTSRQNLINKFNDVFEE